jgi:serine/threonine-protein kinase
MRLLEKDPAARPQRAADVVRALEDGAPPAPRRARAAVALALTLALVAGVGFVAARTRSVPRAAPVAPVADARPSVAVLPFVNTSGDLANEHLSDGLTDELIAALGKVHGLDVVARTSVFALKGRALGVRAVAETLGVTTVLDGTLRRSGDRLKVTAELVRARDGRVLWSESFDSRLRDVLAMQEQIARAIVGALRVRLAVGAAPLVGRATDDPEAYELYLRGRYVFQSSTGRDAILGAARLFERAVARDSTFARAYAGLSDAHARLAAFGYGGADAEFAIAKRAARRALALDSTLAEAHVSLGHALFLHDALPDSAERTLRRALALDPGYALGHSVFAIMLQFAGRYDEAVAQLDSARAIDPLAPWVGAALGRVYVNAHRPDDAIRELRASLELNPRGDLAYQQLGHAYLQKGMAAEGIDALRHAAALSGPRDSAHLAYAYGVTGQRAEARRILDALDASSARRFVPTFDLAVGHAGAGDADAAFRLIDRAIAEHGIHRDGVLHTAPLDVLHGDPRWARLARP